MPDIQGRWTSASPFDFYEKKSQPELYWIKMEVLLLFGNRKSTQAACSSEHFSASLSLTVRVPFENASMTGAYDRTTTKNSNECSTHLLMIMYLQD